MTAISVSPKYQVVIPKHIREALDIRPGQKVEIFQYGEQIVIVPVRPIESMRGFAPGIDTTVDRDEDRV